MVVIVALFAFNTFLKQKTVEAPAPDDTMIEEEEITNTVTAPEQAGGSEVFIERATLTDDGYVVIHEDEDGTPGEVIGASDLLPKGEHVNLIIVLDKEVAEGDVLHAMLHKDDGDGVFDPEKDLPITDAGGNPVAAQFSIIGEGALEDEMKL